MLDNSKRILSDSLSYSYLINSDSLAQRQHTLTYACAITTCRRRMCAYVHGSGAILRSLTIFHIEPIYTHILSAHNHVIIMSYLSHRYILTGYYVFALKHIKMKEKKLDISPFLYIAIMITVYSLAFIQYFPKNSILPHSIQN